MNNLKDLKRCVYCLNYSEEITDDHILPKSWYPKTSSGNLEKWKVPSCRNCNSKLGKVEENIRNKLGLCLDPNDKKSYGIPDTVLRALDPNQGRNERDKKIRQKKRELIKSEIQTPDLQSLKNVLPNFGKISGIKYDELKVIYISPNDLQILTEKIIKGMTYLITKKYIDDSFCIEMYICGNNKSADVLNFINRYGQTYNRGQVFIFKRAIVKDEDFVGLYYFEIWGKLKIYASVIPRRII